MGASIEKPTALERNIMNYTAPFVPYILNPDPVWLQTNTDKALGWQHPRTPMNETVLTGLLERFVTEELPVRQVPAETDATLPATAAMLVGV